MAQKNKGKGTDAEQKKANAAEEKKKEEQAKAAEKEKENDPKTPEEAKAATEKGPEMVRVRVKKEIVQNGGGFYDFESGTNMYPRSHKKIFTVPMTSFIRKKLDTGELILVGAE
jgi:sRNA-binding protein